jgi:hypothetical protein
VREAKQISFGGEDVAVGECRMKDVEALDEFLAGQPRPAIPAGELDDMASAIKAMVAAIGEPTPGMLPPEKMEVHLLNLRTQVGRAVGEQLRSLRDGGGEWPPRYMGTGYRVFLDSAAGRRKLAELALCAADEQMTPERARRLFDEATTSEFWALVDAFSPRAPEVASAGPPAAPAAGPA